MTELQLGNLHGEAVELLQLFLGEQLRREPALTATPRIQQENAVGQLQRMFREVGVDEKRQPLLLFQFLHGLQNAVLIFKVQIGLRLIEYHEFRFCRQSARNQCHLQFTAADTRAKFSRDICDSDFFKTIARNVLIVLARLGKKPHMYRSPQ